MWKKQWREASEGQPIQLFQEWKHYHISYLMLGCKLCMGLDTEEELRRTTATDYQMHTRESGAVHDEDRM